MKRASVAMLSLLPVICVMAQLCWTPSLCSSLTSSDNRTSTPDSWKVCEWSDDGSERVADEWDACEWSSIQSDPNDCEGGDVFPSSPVSPRVSNRTSSSETACDSLVCSPVASSTNVSALSTPAGRSLVTLSPVRKSPRTPKPKSKFDPCRAVTNEEGWQLNSVMQLQGCQPRCAAQVHGLSEYDVLVMHSAFASKTATDKRVWLLDYFANNCPNTPDGALDPKQM